MLINCKINAVIMDLQVRDSSNPFFVFEVSQVCATCTQLLLKGSCYSLDTPIGKTTHVNLYQVLESQFQFKCEENGPSNLCPECFSKTLAMYEFNQQCKKSSQLFNKYLEYQKQFTLDDTDLHTCDTDVNFRNVDEEQNETSNVGPEVIWLCDSTMRKGKFEFMNEDESFENDISIKSNWQNIPSTPDLPPKCKKPLQQTRKSIVLTQKSKQKKLYKCTSCDAVYNNYHSFIDHRNIHNKKFVCSYCDRAVGSKSALIIHERGHSGEHPYPCQICGKEFASNGNLKDHILSHANQRPFKCEVCQDAFKKKFSLHRHMLLHTGVKPYGCSECDRRFIQASHLKIHMRVHEKGKTPGRTKR